jgi:dienelactone hydrolase
MHVLKRTWLAAITLIVLSLSHATAWSDDQFEIVNLHSLTFDGEIFQPFLPPVERGRPATVFGMLRLPPGTRRVPAVVVLHGCAGVTAGETQTAAMLRSNGIATFVVNSFTGREVMSVCRGFRAVNMSSVVTDAYRALALLAAHPRIDPSRIAVIGFSFGGRAAVWASYPRFREIYGMESPRFAAHLAYYPAACFIQLADEDRVDAPIRIFHGTADDWTPIAPCRDYVARLHRTGRDIALFEYEGALHGFNNPSVKPLAQIVGMNFANCRFAERDGAIIDLATGGPAGREAPCVTWSASVGFSPDAQRKAAAEMQGFLGALFRLQ